MTGVSGVSTAPDFDDWVEAAARRILDEGLPRDRTLSAGARKVRYIGEPVVAVLAETRPLAEDALHGIEIGYQPLEAVIDPEIAVSEMRRYARRSGEECSGNA